MISFVKELFREIVFLFIEMAPYLLLGLTVAGVLSVIMKKSFVARHIGHPGMSSVIKASVLGVPLPLCSCGVVPTAAYLNRAGASRPALVSFLISTPQTGVDSIIATYGMLGPLFAVFRPIAALLAGIAGGAVSLFAGRGPKKGEGTEAGAKVPPAASSAAPPAVPKETDEEGGGGLRSKLRGFLSYAYIEAIDDISVQFLVGLSIGGLVSILIPADFFSGRAIGSGLPAMLLMVLVGIPIYVCSTSSIPIAVALIAKGLSPGAAYVFLVAGPATNMATLAVLYKVLGRRQTVLYVASLIGASLAFGPIMGWITAIAGWTPPASLHAGHGGGFMLQDYLLGGLFALLILASLFRRWWPEEWMPWKDSAAAEQALSDTEPPSGTAPLYDVLSVEGMTCHHCAANVEDAVRSVHGVTGARVDLKGKKVFIEGPVLSRDPEAIAKAVRRAGYEPAGYGE